MKNISHKTEEGINTIVNKAKKVFNKDDDEPNNNNLQRNYNSHQNYSGTKENNQNVTVNYHSENTNAKEMTDIKMENKGPEIQSEVNYPKFEKANENENTQKIQTQADKNTN